MPKCQRKEKKLLLDVTPEELNAVIYEAQQKATRDVDRIMKETRDKRPMARFPKDGD